VAFGPLASPGAYRCQNHPDREGVGVCVRCRRVICAECSTKIDRMNFCTTCLGTLGGPPDRGRGREEAGGPVTGLFFLLVGYAALTALFLLLGLVVATLRPGL
jgi:hypothetical protein